MRTAAVVAAEMPSDRGARFANAVVGSEINILVFDAAPQPLDEHVVAPNLLPSILIAMPFAVSTPVNAGHVNCGSR